MKRPLLVTAAIIFDDEKFLLIKRAREPFKNFWSFSGGCGAFARVSDPLEAVKQEVKCDLDCDFHANFFTYAHENFENKPTVVLYFYGKINGKITLNPKYVLECKWFSIKELKHTKLGFDHNKIVEEFLKKPKK